VVVGEGQLSKLEASCTCITAQIILELTKHRYYAVSLRAQYSRTTRPKRCLRPSSHILVFCL
jgi:hypothetical protein